jgi:ABC-type sulfate transport system permease subunit
MLRKIMYGFSAGAAWLTTTSVAFAQTCTVNGQEVECPQWVSTVGPGLMIVWLVIAVVIIAAMWKVFQKAGKPGWAAIVPIYNTVVMLDIVKRPLWWILLLLIPFVNIIFSIILMNDIAKAFGKGIGFTLGLIFLPFIFWPILGFGNAQYQGAVSDVGTMPPQQPPQPPVQPTQM